jgi:hypothetical protein
MEKMTKPEKDHLVHQLSADIRQSTGRNYQIDWECLDVTSIRELMRLLIDLKNETIRSRRNPWQGAP